MPKFDLIKFNGLFFNFQKNQNLTIFQKNIIRFIKNLEQNRIINIFGGKTIFIKDEKFRNLFANFIVIKDEEFAKRQAKLFHMDEIWGDDEDPGDVELFEKIENYELEEEVNSLLVLPYVDHQAGFSFQTVAVCLLKDSDLLVYERADDFQAMSNIRWDAVTDFEFEYLDNLNVNADFDIEEYKSHARDVFKHYNDDKKILVLRMLPMLDEYRNEQHPDDILVFFFKEGLTPEGMWVRYEDFNEEHEIFGRLLNQPNQDFGVNMGDAVKFSFAKNQDGALICVCDLDE